jgi:glycosyltransferase involved in cell wall biosynthesis
VLTRLTHGGAEANILHFAAWQQAAGFDVEFAVGSVTRHDVGANKIHLMPALTRAVSPVNDPRAFIELRRLIKSRGYGLIQTHHAKAGILGRLAAADVATARVHTFHGTSFGQAYGASSGPYLFSERVAARWTDRFVTVGEELRDRYVAARVGHPHLYRIIRSPIDVEDFGNVRSMSPEMRAASRAKMGLASASAVVAVVGALEPRKRPVELLGWLATWLRDSADRYIVYAGEGPLMSALANEAASAGISNQVQLLGWREDVVGLFAASDLLAVGSLNEGVPQVVVQALAAGLPVVSTDVCGLREVVGGRVVVVPHDGTGMADAVMATIKNPPPKPRIEAFEPWRRPSVEAAIASLHRELRLT